ncbi:Palmitoyltransferase PFA4 [Psilocybe cubensis]|uniref:Palmitoyltransferase PFA4 n=1 Tax=Psilocybe cubensis TaxID=181762 RepID=A0ACB8HFM8_PSICU|nr:Palmitoyltransferase PFA4 [Psilocybe cubensis]KAH9486296.1 Palmitoyltransferase PFA4 [Psilocybe cubensis]
MVTKRVLYSTGGTYWDNPSALELIMIVMNYVACIPVLLAVGGFSIYHFFSLIRNTTTIEGWEKDKISIMVKRGKTREVKFPYDLGMRRNVESVLGRNPLLWCCPIRPPGSGLKFQLSDSDGAPWPPKEDKTKTWSASESSEDAIDMSPSASPWTYKNGSVNPALSASNSQMRTRRRRTPKRNIPGTSSLPPYHPNYKEEEEYHDYYTTSSEEEEISNSVPGNVRVRRGSEGYEVLPSGREDMLRRYLTEIGEEPGRYIRYIPQPDETDSDDDKPLIYTMANGEQ